VSHKHSFHSLHFVLILQKTIYTSPRQQNSALTEAIYSDGPAIHWVAATIARMITAKMRLMIYQPSTRVGDPDSLSEPRRNSLFMSSIEIMEYTHLLMTEPSTSHWRWLFQTYTQWFCIAYILGEIALRDSSIVVDRAWRTIERVMRDPNGALSKNNSGMLVRKILLFPLRTHHLQGPPNRHSRKRTR